MKFIYPRTNEIYVNNNLVQIKDISYWIIQKFLYRIIFTHDFFKLSLIVFLLFCDALLQDFFVKNILALLRVPSKITTLYIKNVSVIWTKNLVKKILFFLTINITLFVVLLSYTDFFKDKL